MLLTTGVRVIAYAADVSSNYNSTHRTTNNNTHKATTTIHTRQLQQYTRPTNNNYTQNNYNNTHGQPTTITHNTTTTIHTANQQQLHTTQLKTSNKTHETNYNTTCTKGKNTPVRQYCVQFVVIVCSNHYFTNAFTPVSTQAKMYSLCKW